MNQNTLAARPSLEALRLQPGNTALAQAIRAWLETGDNDHLRQVLGEHHEFDVALVLAALQPDEAIAALATLPLDPRAELFGYLPSESQTELSRRLGRRDLAAIVSAMSHDERVDLFKTLDESAQADLLPALAQAEREDLRKLASYKEGTVGSVMTSDYAVLTSDLTVSQALAELRIQAPDSETIYLAYIVDED